MISYLSLFLPKKRTRKSKRIVELREQGTGTAGLSWVLTVLANTVPSEQSLASQGRLERRSE